MNNDERSSSLHRDQTTHTLGRATSCPSSSNAAQGGSAGLSTLLSLSVGCPATDNTIIPTLSPQRSATDPFLTWVMRTHATPGLGLVPDQSLHTLAMATLWNSSIVKGSQSRPKLPACSTQRRESCVSQPAQATRQQRTLTNTLQLLGVLIRCTHACGIHA
jgi:hypothetical protein